MPRFAIALSILCLWAAPAFAEVAGPDVVELAVAKNPAPDSLPTIRVVKEKLWGKYYPMVSVRFPNVPDFQCDAWCYEAAVDFLDARPLDQGVVEMRHRDQQNPQALVVTTITPTPGSVIFEARMLLDEAEHAGTSLPPAPSGLNLCWQLRHAPAFASAPDPYPDFMRRCFIFTERGQTLLGDTGRSPIPVQTPDHEYNNPPWVQNYTAAWRTIPITPPTSWAGTSPDRFLTPVIGVLSRDYQYLAALANGANESLCQAWHDCVHNNPRWLPEGAPVADQRWRLGVYVMENQPKALLERVAQDFPGEKPAVILGEPPQLPDGWTAAATRDRWLALHPGVAWAKSLPMGPFVRLADGGILGVEETRAIISHDEGVSWEGRPIPPEVKVSSERALLRAKDGAIVLVCLNMTKAVWNWDQEKSLPAPDTELDVWAVRSTDDGQTWTDAQMIYDGYSGDIHHLLQTANGRIIAPVQILMYDDGRHALQPRYSDDSGKTWQRSNLLDIGGRGHHDGIIEPTLAQRADGRVWMLCRTNLGQFWSAWSDNDGEDFRELEPSGIPASSAPGTFTRLASGRLMLIWNRPAPEGQAETPPESMAGGDRQWSDERVSNFRSEISVALSDDDGKTWTPPRALVKSVDAPRASLAYHYVFEHQPGEIWLTTMQGEVRVSFKEADLLGKGL